VSRETRAQAALASLPPAHGELVRAVLRAADAAGVSVLLVGGPVRDFLLGRPLVDVDLLIEDPDPARAGDLAAGAAGGAGRVTRHERCGTAELHTPEATIDFATVRTESYAHPGALPIVAPGDLAQDLARRDFSVNALALPLSRVARARHPEIVDLFDGVADLGARRLRVLHDKSIHDDPTRALRAARLGPLLGFRLTSGTRTALRSALRDGSFGPVSGVTGCAASSSACSRTRTAGSIPLTHCACSTTGTCSARWSPGSSCPARPRCRCGGSAA